MRAFFALVSVAIACSFVSAVEPTPEQVFEARLLPIFKSPDPSSCVQCHLVGVDLRNYLRPSHRETFLSLRDQGLIDLDAPAKSRILALIDMGRDDAGAKLVHAKVRKAEYEAFAAWIAASAADPALRAAPKLDADKLAKPPRPDEVIRHARKDRLVESFANTVWAMRFRCMNCHTEGHEATKKYLDEHGAKIAWFKKDGPEATLKYLMESKLLDTKNPERSLLLRKPLNDVKHGGGQKFVVGDQGYKAFRRFLEDYAAIVNDQYTSAKELPPSSPWEAFGTEVRLKIDPAPEAWSNKLLAVKVFAWDDARKGWAVDPVAVSDRLVGRGKPGTPATVWQHNLTLLAAKGSATAKAWRTGAPKLPEGRYLVKVYLDADGRLAKDWNAEMTDADYVGQAEVRTAWPSGWGSMTTLDAKLVRNK